MGPSCQFSSSSSFFLHSAFSRRPSTTFGHRTPCWHGLQAIAHGQVTARLAGNCSQVLQPPAIAAMATTRPPATAPMASSDCFLGRDLAGPGHAGLSTPPPAPNIRRSRCRCRQPRPPPPRRTGRARPTNPRPSCVEKTPWTHSRSFCVRAP
jgi:hypothetical protein